MTTTPEHPFYVTQPSGTQPKPVGHEDLNEHWVGAGRLSIGDKIKQADGTVGVVANVVTVQQTQQMFNLTVDEAHTFYVGEKGWLVHNVRGAAVRSFAWDHIFKNHSEDGLEANQSGQKSIFNGMSQKQIKAQVQSAWRSRQLVSSQSANESNGVIERYQGVDQKTGKVVEMYFDVDTKTVKTAYQIDGKRIKINVSC
ncbi:polymorphic toxin-type HINT domain-containing protein [Deinococcus sp.]|uniref:polymorphic toxin-type HINT domain-containing protein n=1 Tax=Deinococcus sp. TaxID=47478 RepID=UPI003B5BFF9D